MTPSQRLYTALSGQKPDRVPVMPKIWVDSAAALTGTSLPEVIEDPAVALRVVVDAALAVGADGARQFHLPARRTRREDDRLVEIDDRGRRLGWVDLCGGLATQRETSSGLRLDDPFTVAFLQFYSTPDPLLMNPADIRHLVVPDKSFYEAIGCGQRQRNIMAEVGGRIALVGDCGSPTLAFYALLRGLDRALMDLLEEPALVHAAMEKGAAMAVERGKFNIDLGIRMLRVNDSVANMNVISPGLWREFVLPHLRDVCTELHRYDPHARLYCHICGNVRPVIEDLVATGLDCIGPLDPLGQFTCAEARQAVGRRVALMGGVHTLSFVNHTAESVCDEARACIRGAGQNGGYILSSGCALPRSARRENVEALMTAARLDLRTIQNIPIL